MHRLCYRTRVLTPLLAALLWLLTPAYLPGQFDDMQADPNALPRVPPGFQVTVFAREPLVRQPCSMAFDAAGRLFVGMGPQYRNPQPDTPGDSVVMVLDTDSDGVADATKVFASGFNAVQGLAWRGSDLWVANAPDLTVVRDLDGDDEADEYVRVYTDLGNLEHGLHGLNWAPDGKLYMSKGNSKGLTQPGRIAPQPFRELWGVTAPPETPDFPEPQTFSKQQYQRAYHDPADDWGREGGILRCDDGGENLEIVARGLRNPWDIAADSGFHWLGTDNDQTTGDRVVMPFVGAHFGWNHAWSSHWSTEPHPPTAPVSGPLFEGSGTGLVFYDSPQFPEDFRRVFFINDWLRKTTFLWRPVWEGALMRPAGGRWEAFIEGGTALYRPTDIEVGPDGALWVLGWSSGYGAQWKDGELTSEGRIFRIAWQEAAGELPRMAAHDQPLRQRSLADLIADFSGPLPVWRSDAQQELVRRGAGLKDELIAALQSGALSEAQETWVAWTLGRIAPEDRQVDAYFTDQLTPAARVSLNLRIQSVRVLAHRMAQLGRADSLPDGVVALLTSDQPRLRFAAVEAILESRDRRRTPQLAALLATESDRTIFYAAWQTLRRLSSPADLRAMLSDPRAGVRRAALLALAESEALSPADAESAAQDDSVAALWLETIRGKKESLELRGRPLASSAAAPVSTAEVSLIRQITARSGRTYRSVPGGLHPGSRHFTDRDYRLKQIPQHFINAEFIQTANEDDGCRGEDFLAFEALLPLRVHVGIDTRMPQPPSWIAANFQRSEQQIQADHWTYQLYHRDFAAGPIQLGGNTDDGQSGGKSHYIVVLEPRSLPRPERPATIDEVLANLGTADAARGEILFRHAGGAGCVHCHRLDATGNGFGPNLSDIGRRANAKHIVQAILDPSAVITEGFQQQLVVTEDGKIHSGVLLEESGLSLTLGLATGQRMTLRKDAIEARKSTAVSAMPAVAPLLACQQVADLTAFLLQQQQPVSDSGEDRESGFHVEEQPDRLLLSHSGKAVAEFVFRDERIRRPYFANVHAPGGALVTRNHPPIPGLDATDHDTMHPGIWLAMGDLSGHDFWRNKATIEHLRFSQAPVVADDQIRFTTQSRLLSAEGTEVCQLTSRFQLTARPAGWLLIWQAEFRSDEHEFSFGDQEEMGFGARMATALIETNGGLIVNSQGRKSAAETWGQPAAWCDYSGATDSHREGITLMSDPANFRECWWHNRDYGVFVANPFGRAAMQQGPASKITVARGEPFTLRFAALLHDAADYNPQQAYQDFLEQLEPDSSQD